MREAWDRMNWPGTDVALGLPLFSYLPLLFPPPHLHGSFVNVGGIVNME